MNRPILVADDMRVEKEDGARRSVSVRTFAGHLAALLEAPMDLMHVEDVRLSLAMQAFYGRRSTAATHAQSPSSRRGEVRRLIVEGIPADEILRFSRMRPAPQLLVIGTRGRTGLKSVVLGSVAEKVIQESRIPVMTVGPKVKLPHQNPFAGTRKQPMCILVATDLGLGCRKAEAYAASLARRIGAEVTLLHSPFGERRFYDLAGASLGRDEDLRAAAAGALEKRRQSLERGGVRCSSVFETRETFTWQSILRLVGEKGEGHQLVVMGTRTRARLARAFVGSTAREVILRSPVPVITLAIQAQ